MLDEPKLAEAVSQYERLGFAGPIKAFEPGEIHDTTQAVMREVDGADATFIAKRNRHLDWDVVRALTNAPSIRALAAGLLGPELVLWRTQIFVGERGRGLGWHQDEYNTQLADPSANVSFHLALTAAREDNCVMVVPGSHRMTRDDLAGRGFNYIAGSDAKSYGAPAFWRDPDARSEAVRMVLAPGEFFAFHPRLLHASRDVTRADDKKLAGPSEAPRDPAHPLRIGIALRVVTPENEVFPSAFAETLARGDHSVRL